MYEIRVTLINVVTTTIVCRTGDKRLKEVNKSLRFTKTVPSFLNCSHLAMRNSHLELKSLSSHCLHLLIRPTIAGQTFPSVQLPHWPGWTIFVVVSDSSRHDFGFQSQRVRVTAASFWSPQNSPKLVKYYTCSVFFDKKVKSSSPNV